MLYGIIAVTAHGAFQPSDELIFAAYKEPIATPPVLSLQSLALGGPSAGSVSNLFDVGTNAGGLFTQVSTLVHGSHYILGLQEAGVAPTWTPSRDCAASVFGPCAAGSVCCVDPKAEGIATGACYKVSSCAALHGPASQHGLLLGYDLATREPLFRLNASTTPICWHLAVDTARHPGKLLCLSERAATTTAMAAAVHGSVDTNYVVAVDVSSGAVTDVGAFPPNLIIGENVATYDSAAGVFYALLAPPPPTQPGPEQPLQLCGMNVMTGNIVSQAPLPLSMNILNMDFDATTNLTNAVVHNTTFSQTAAALSGAMDVLSVTECFARLDMSSLAYTPVGPEGAYAARGFNQINAGFGSSLRREYLMTAFKINATSHAAHLFLVGTDMDRGGVVYEYQRPGTGVASNLIDMALYAPS